MSHSDPHIAGRHGADGLIACHECDRLHRLAPLPAGGEARCGRCGATLYRNVPHSLDRSAALYLAALFLFIMANVFPFIALKFGERVEQTVLVSGAFALGRAGMPELGVLVFLTSFLFPLLTLGGMLYVVMAHRLGTRPPYLAAVYRMVSALAPWSLIGVFMLALLVSIVKLMDMASVVPGTGLYAFVALLVVASAAVANFEHGTVWPRIGPRTLPAGGGDPHASQGSAAKHGLIACHVCELLVEARRARAGCPRCGSALHAARKPESLSRTWALLAAATVLLIPANVYPVMTVIQLGQGEPNTILSGVLHLIQAGMWPLALLVFFASFVVPFSKIAVLVLLLVTVQRGSGWRPRDRTRLYRITEVIGAWSMVDVFLVAILVALVNMDSLATVRPGPGVPFFAAAVIATMLAAHAFDPRLIWDRAGRGRAGEPGRARGIAT